MVSPAEQIFDAVAQTHRSKWQDAAKALNINGLIAKVDVDGSLNRARCSGRSSLDRRDADPGRRLPADGPPSDGEQWAVFYRIVKSPSALGSWALGLRQEGTSTTRRTSGPSSSRSLSPLLKRPKAVGPGAGASSEGGNKAQKGLVPTLKVPSTKMATPAGVKLAPKAKGPSLPTGPAAPATPAGK